MSLFCVLTTSKVILGWVSTCDSAHLWQLYTAAPLGDQATNQAASEISPNLGSTRGVVDTVGAGS